MSLEAISRDHFDPGGTISDLDRVDWRLIHTLAESAPIDVHALAGELNLPETEIETRLERLLDAGVVSGVRAEINATAVGLPVTAFFMIRVAQNADAYQAIERLIKDIDQVEEAHAVGGQYDWIVKVRAESPEDLRLLLTGRLALLPGFVRAETMVVMGSACDRVNVEAALHPRVSR